MLPSSPTSVMMKTISNPTKTTTTTKPKKRSLTFATNAKVVDIPDLETYSDQEIEDSWYSQDEYRAMFENRQHDINAADADEVHSTKLGTHPPQAVAERRQRIQDARLAVLDEQALQWDEGVHDEELVADVYFDATRYSQLLAYDRADSLVQDLRRQRILDQQTMWNDRRKIATAAIRRARAIASLQKTVAATTATAASSASVSVSSPTTIQHANRSAAVFVA